MNSTDSLISAEPERKTAYSNDLRWRIVHQRIALNLPLVKIAQNLNVAISTVHHTYRLFEESGTADPLSPQKSLDCRRLDIRSELQFVGVILENPSMYLGIIMFGGYAGVWYRDFPKYCVQDTENKWTHEKEDS